MAQPAPLPLTVSCFSKIQIGFTFLVPAHPGSPGQRAVTGWMPFLPPNQQRQSTEGNLHSNRLKLHEAKSYV